MVLRESKLKPKIKRYDLEDLLKNVLSLSENLSIHAVYSQQDRGANWLNGQMEIERSPIDNRLIFSALRFENPYPFYDLHSYEAPMNSLPPIHTGDAEETPDVLKKYKPRRIIIEDTRVLMDIDHYIQEPYGFIGFETRLHDLGVGLFASSKDKKAGLKFYRTRKEAHDLAKELNKIVYPQIRIGKVVG